MRYGRITLTKEQLARLCGWGVRFFLSAALTACQTPGGYAPFALGAVAAAGAGGDGAAALAGAGVGAALFLSFADALPFLASGVLIVHGCHGLSGQPLSGGAAGDAPDGGGHGADGRGGLMPPSPWRPGTI